MTMIRRPMTTVPTFSTPIYSGSLQIGTLNQQTRRIHLFHSPFTYYVHSTRPGTIIYDHHGQRIGTLGFSGQMHRD